MLGYSDSLRHRACELSELDWADDYARLFPEAAEAPPPHCVVALHACDQASDKALQLAVRAKAATVAVGVARAAHRASRSLGRAAALVGARDVVDEVAAVNRLEDDARRPIDAQPADERALLALVRVEQRLARAHAQLARCAAGAKHHRQPGRACASWASRSATDL